MEKTLFSRRYEIYETSFLQLICEQAQKIMCYLYFKGKYRYLVFKIDET